MSSETEKNLDEILAAVMGVDPDDRAPDLEDMRAWFGFWTLLRGGR